MSCYQCHGVVWGGYVQEAQSFTVDQAALLNQSCSEQTLNGSGGCYRAVSTSISLDLFLLFFLPVIIFFFVKDQPASKLWGLDAWHRWYLGLASLETCM